MKVQINSLTVRYGVHQALRGVSLAMHPGRVLGVVGPNGSGKSTLVKALAGQVKSEGLIQFDDHAVRPNAIGYMPQDTVSGAALTVLEAVLLGRLGHLRLRVSADDLDAVQQMLDRLGLLNLADRYLNEVSGGQRQMVFLAQALVGDPRVLLLDEPISALDICHQLEVLETVRVITRERGLSTLVVLHDLNAAVRFTDDLLLLHGGSVLAQGSAAEVLTPQHIRQAFRVEVQRVEQAGQPPHLIALRAMANGD